MRSLCLMSILLVAGCAGARKATPSPVAAPAEPSASATPQSAPPPAMPPPPAEPSTTNPPVVERQAEAAIPQAEPGSIDVSATLRQAARLAQNGAADQASELYERVSAATNSSRDARAAAATGLYRIGAYPAAVRAFARLGSFLRGEEDLRYYDAVSLFETGDYEQARIELSCALPYLQVTEDVARYREKIERMANRPGTP